MAIQQGDPVNLPATTTGNHLKDDGTWTTVGDVTGPGSATDNAIVRFNGTGGKIVQEYTSNAPTIADDGTITAPGGMVLEGETLVTYTVAEAANLLKPPVEAHTADDTLTETESGSIHTNLGEDGAMTLTLPDTALAGVTFHFAVVYADELRVKVGAAATKIYAVGAVNTDDGGNDGYMTANDEGECMTLVSDGNGDWFVISMYGTWVWTQP